MIFDYYFKIPKRIRIIIIFFLILAFVYFILRFFFAETRSIPEEFLKARQQASVIAQEIVSLSDESTKNIEKISDLDRNHDYTQALNLVSDELRRNQDARQKAVQLSFELETMAKNLSQISPMSASQIALEAVSSETTLISRLINYNDYLTQLLNLLQDKFTGKNNGDGTGDLVKKLNNEAQAINDLNQGFNDTMKQFDSQ